MFRVILLLIMVLLFAQAILLEAGGAMGYYKQKARQNSIVHGVESINLASNQIVNELETLSKQIADNQYKSLYNLTEAEDSAYLPENELNGFFRAGFANEFKEYFGDNSGQICERINEFIVSSEIENVTAYDDGNAKLLIEEDDSGNIFGIKLCDITLCYDNPAVGDRFDTIGFSVRIPDAVFYYGNEDLFEYCLVGKRGIYVTGSTSSIIGDIYAGDHSDEDIREAEIIYGETEFFGGLNILSTQLGVEAGRIMSKADINVNGSFAIFAPRDDSLFCFGHHLNKIGGYKEEAIYSLDGIFFSLDKTDEKALNDYYEYEKSINQGSGRLGMISGYYDSKNDSEYEGTYRKIISDSDVIIDESMTGVVLTPYNVVIDPDVNFEGLIMCGDRIYISGNNNIVSNTFVMRDIVRDELENSYRMEAKDYMGGINSPGLNFAERIVVPYR